jgi:DNA polymerase-3 subunit gamma/tau
MYDEINRKGFEGDTVINGIAEFLRNLLVSSDAKVAMLLEVAEDFKQKYLQTAQKIPAGFIISALNILNEAEINYKQARNKRLHVELTLIKLSYLQQALELVNNDGGISKKKIVDGAKTVAFRALPVIKAGKEEQVALPVTAQTKAKVEPEYQSRAKLMIEEPEVKLLPTDIGTNLKPPTSNTEQETELRDNEPALGHCKRSGKRYQNKTGLVLMKSRPSPKKNCTTPGDYLSSS